LAGRFPETANAIDLDGRTPLHYAATLADNGHYYNLLLHLGANPLVQDNVSVIMILLLHLGANPLIQDDVSAIIVIFIIIAILRSQIESSVLFRLPIK